MSRTIRIYPDSWASITRESAGKKYRPSNGTEGAIFMEAWCGDCQRDKSMREGAPLEDCDDNERCDIIAETFAYEVDDQRYPAAWVYGKDGQPLCTAFVAAGLPIPPERDTRTIDMFSGDAALHHEKQQKGVGE